eukprot:746872-Hanusia_phi.AAC.3
MQSSTDQGDASHEPPVKQAWAMQSLKELPSTQDLRSRGDGGGTQQDDPLQDDGGLQDDPPQEEQAEESNHRSPHSPTKEAAASSLEKPARHHDTPPTLVKTGSSMSGSAGGREGKNSSDHTKSRLQGAKRLLTGGEDEAGLDDLGRTQGAEGGRRKEGEQEEEGEAEYQLDLRAVLREMDFENSVFSKEERRVRSRKRLVQAEKKYFERKIKSRKAFEDRETEKQQAPT